MFAATASLVCFTAEAVTYTYTSPDLFLQNPLDSSLPNNPIRQSYSFWFDEVYLGGTTAGATVSVELNGGPFLEPPVERAYRDGLLLPYDPYLHGPIATTTMAVGSFGGGFDFTFDNLGEVAAFSFWTDGEFSSISFSTRGASVYGCTICPYTPNWEGSGPGTWTHDPIAPIPIGSTLPLAMTGLLMLSGIRRSSVRLTFRRTRHFV